MSVRVDPPLSTFARLKSKRAACLACTDPIAPCACSSSQTCVLVGQSCTQCAQNICRDNVQIPSKSGKSASTGVTVGGALGGVLAVAAAVGLVYWFWWKPRGLAASRKRYSRHVSARQSRMMAAGDKKGGDPLSPRLPAAAGAGAAAADGVAKRSSVHLRLDGAGQDSSLTRRPTTPGGTETSEGPSSTGATAGRHNRSDTYDLDNPFGDHARSSIGTSDFSFRSSHSTNIIPIAYIPPHSNSLSVSDASRGAYGELDTGENIPMTMSAMRLSTAGSFASQDSRDSLALAGADGIHLNPLPPVLTPGSPIVPLSASATGGPIRPPRSPGLDLQLPKGVPTSPLASPPADPSRPVSGFPWSAPPPSAGASHFSMATKRASANSYLTAPGSEPAGRNKTQHLSTLSTISSSTSRSAGSTMSYILDPPQIITPVNAQGLRRVEVMGRQQAGLVTIGGSAAPSTPPTPATVVVNPASPAASSVTTPRGVPDESSTFSMQQMAAPLEPATDPFADNARFSVGGLTGGAESSPTLSLPDLSGSEAGWGSELGSELNDPRWTFSSASDVPQSARNSGVDTGSHSRPLTGASEWGESGLSVDPSRISLASTVSDNSMLDGIPFLPPSSSAESNMPPSSPLFPRPPPRSPSLNSELPELNGPPSPAISLAASSPAPYSDHRHSQYSYDTTYSDASASDAPLQPPARPFAGETSAFSNNNNRQSETMSVRSGFGSGLSQIPFTLGFPGLNGGSERGSVVTMDSRMDGMSRDSLMSHAGSERTDRDSYQSDVGVLSGVEEQTEPGESKRESLVEAAEEVDPFGVHAEVDGAEDEGDRTAEEKVAEEEKSVESADRDEASSSDKEAALSTATVAAPSAPVAAITNPVPPTTAPGADPRASTDSMAIALSQELERALSAGDDA